MRDHSLSRTLGYLFVVARLVGPEDARKRGTKVSVLCAGGRRVRMQDKRLKFK